MASDLLALTIADLQSILRRRKISPREVIDALRTQIDDVDPKIGAYLSLDFNATLKEAESADVDRPLGGVPIAIKDVISVAGQLCTCRSKILRSYRGAYDATDNQKMRAGRAIPFCETNIDDV